MSHTEYDVIIVGAGAAGLMAAIQARRLNLSVLLLDSQKKIGAKILMSGGTRCNVTNQEVSVRDYNTESPRAVRDVLAAFPAAATVDFFESNGVKLILDKKQKYFPQTNSAKTILKTFLEVIQENKIDLVTANKVEFLRLDGQKFIVGGSGFFFHSKAVLLATGGLSYPSTGSNGGGYRLAKQFGHRLVNFSPALTPLTTADPDWISLRGLSLPCRLTLRCDQKEIKGFTDDFLFTHFGFSGPVVLNISRHWIHAQGQSSLKLDCSFLPGVTRDSLDRQIKETTMQRPQFLLKSILGSYLPVRLGEIILKKSGLSAEIRISQLRREQRYLLIQNLLAYPLPVKGARGFGQAEVTAGGVDLSEINPATLESRKQRGLFFAGEILDVDGRIGGFNFQWAWSSGVVAGRGVKKSLSV